MCFETNPAPCLPSWLSPSGRQADGGALDLPDSQRPHQVGGFYGHSMLQRSAGKTGSTFHCKAAVTLHCVPASTSTQRAALLVILSVSVCARSMAGVNTNNVARLAEAIHKVTTA